MERGDAAGERSSLPRMLSALYKRGFTGRLEVTEGAEKSMVFYRKGRVVKAYRPDGLDTLEQVLIQERLVSARAIEEAKRLPNQSEEEIAATIVRTGAAKKEALQAGLGHQIRRQLLRAFYGDGARMDAVAAEHPFRGKEAPLGAELDARMLIFAGVRAGYDDARLARELAQIAGARVRLNAVSPSFLAEAGFPDKSDPTIAELLGGGIEISETWLRTPLDRKKSPAKAIVLSLHCLDLLDVNRQAAPGPEAPAAPRKRTGVTGLNALDPATVLQMAESFFKNGDTVRAERAFALVLKSDAHNRRAQAFVAWINYWKPGTNRTIATAETTRAVRDSIRADPKFAYGHFFYGQLLKLQNDHDTAIKAFRAALEHDATLTDAERELRLLTMRKK
jgi:tetratricopeptide (TPR) repeat protein